MQCLLVCAYLCVCVCLLLFLYFHIKFNFMMITLITLIICCMDVHYSSMLASFQIPVSNVGDKKPVNSDSISF